MMQDLIAKIGKGAKTCKDLTWEESKQAMAALIEGKATPAQVGGFLIGMRMKGESVAELAAFTATARSYVAPLKVSQAPNLVDVACYAGKQDTFSAIAGATILAASAGASVLVHGWDGLPERPGVSATFAQLGLVVDGAPAVVEQSIAAHRFAYLDIATYHPPIARLLSMRQELGVRNFVHPVARMLNPSRAAIQVVGMTHPPYFEKIVEALGMLGSPRAFVIRGVDGEPELSIGGPSRLTEWRGDRPIPLNFHPKDAGLEVGTMRDMAGFAPSEKHKEAQLLAKILRGEVTGAPRDWVALNAGLLLYAARVSPSIPAGVDLARKTLDSGAAGRTLDALTQSRAASASA
ncbi:MAG: anthranilate phosphoribosyltransferase [Nitrospiraceae bacterium]